MQEKEPKQNEVNGNESEKSTEKKLKEDWMIRRCAYYDDEYSDCTSIKARFNQYFIFGESIDCGQWKRDSINCYKYVDENDLNAGAELIKSEKARRIERLKPHYANDVWERRKSPPDDWNKPLPEHIQKEYENSYLNIKAMEMRGEIRPTFDPGFNGMCTIL